jgi:pyrroline-5-carboxylate reductase
MSDRPKLPAPTWFVGCGNMGRAMLDGWRAGEIDFSGLTVIRPSGEAVPGVRTVTDFADAGPAPDMVVLAFKPQQLDEVAPKLRTWLTAHTTIVSILAGVETASLRQRFPGVASIIRAVPNLAVSVRRGVTGLYSEDVPDRLAAQLGDLFTTLGFAMWMTDEPRLAALGSVSGAGPAYVARFIAALTKAGVQRGLTEEIAAIIARETVLGTAWMAAATGEDMAAIAARVASPQGTTEAGLAVLDRDAVLDELVDVAIAAAARRGAELAEEAKAKSPSLAEPASLS